ncbi:HAD-IIIC family phosphatase [Streptomyces sp. ME19-01-6]|uniref:HAD-IIIC family phosphatase n=1 Tax=Streptomyces sp. ME19-01-6 TaxID=3028686 RepID=UPI0029B51267|nr:HAD-IIIC family phosphatase [Streptomyces sp. ME19-01-6]MDX3229144.1 HAD-IIIC family phosphatase [Streptomyces sp. ME19-01-6]
MGTVKCLVWDLDNTLWRGVLLENDTLTLRPGVLEVLSQLDERGILHSVASRNDHEDAWERLEKLGVAEYFVLPQIGWGRKSDSVRTIAEQLNFAPETIAFIDDQHTERAEVTHHLPDVRCYDAQQAAGLAALPEFSPVVTADARQRRSLYQRRFQRDAARSAFTGPDEDFVRSLRMRMRINRARAEDVSRVEELTLRTSQMNATGVHYSSASLRALVNDPTHEVLVATVEDRFGSHGAVGVVLLQRRPYNWRLKLLATSCRVVNFGIGTQLLRWVTDQAARAGVHLEADFRRTARNRIMEVAYRFAGFGSAPCECRGDDLPSEADEGVQRLHLVPQRQSAPTTLTTFGATLWDADGTPGQWS